MLWLIIILVFLLIYVVTILYYTKRSKENTLAREKAEKLLEEKTLQHLSNIREELDNIAWTIHNEKVQTYQRSEEETKSVVLIEGRDHELLGLCISNIQKQLGDWPLHVIGSRSNQEMLDKLDITVTILDTDNITLDEYNDLLVSKRLWRDIITTDRVLLTQIDAWLCDKSLINIEDFFIYDYVGAPWDKAQVGAPSSLVGNCGLCLCRTATMLALLARVPFSLFREEYGTNAVDLYFSKYIGNKPSRAVAKTFAVENVWFPKPIGVHKPFRLDRQVLEKLEPNCSGVLHLLKYKI